MTAGMLMPSSYLLVEGWRVLLRALQADRAKVSRRKVGGDDSGE